MFTIENAQLVLKDKDGNVARLQNLGPDDFAKIRNAIADIGKLVDPVSHLPIKATATTVGVVQLADAEAIAAGTTGRVVDAKQLQDAVMGVSPANCVTNVAAGSTANKIKVTKDGYTTTIEIDHVEHASFANQATHATLADTAASANSVAWDNVSDKPSSYTPSSHDHSGYGMYFQDVCPDTNTGWYESRYREDDNQHFQLYINDYFGIHFCTTGPFEVNGHAIISEGNIGSQSVNYANSAGSVAWANVSGKPSSYTPSSHTHDDRYYTESEIDTKLGGKANTSGAMFTGNGLSAPGWSKIGTGEGGSCIQVTTNDNTYPSICFHRAGYSHCVLAESGGQLGTMQEGNGTFNHLITSANIGFQSVNYANSAGSVAWGNVSGRPDIWIG